MDAWGGEHLNLEHSVWIKNQSLSKLPRKNGVYRKPPHHWTFLGCRCLFLIFLHLRRGTQHAMTIFTNANAHLQARSNVV